METAVNNSALYVAKGINLKSSHRRKKLYGDECQLNLHGNQIAIYACIKSLFCTPKTNITSYGNHKAGHENSKENYFRLCGQGSLSFKVMIPFQHGPREVLGETWQVFGRNMFCSEAQAIEMS